MKKPSKQSVLNQIGLGISFARMGSRPTRMSSVETNDCASCSLVACPPAEPAISVALTPLARHEGYFEFFIAQLCLSPRMRLVNVSFQRQKVGFEIIDSKWAEKAIDWAETYLMGGPVPNSTNCMLR